MKLSLIELRHSLLNSLAKGACLLASLPIIHAQDLSTVAPSIPGKNYLLSLNASNTQLPFPVDVIALKNSTQADEASRRRTAFRCERIHANTQGLWACLSRWMPLSVGGKQRVLGAPQVHVVNAQGDIVHSSLAGGTTPSRVQVSPNGQWVASTSFILGNSYGGKGGLHFSTDTRMTRVGHASSSLLLQNFQVHKAGQVIRSPNLQFWGVTFSPLNPDEFYVTIYINDARHIARGSIKNQSVDIVLTGYECPSFSPNGKHLAMKRSSKEGAQHPSVLHLADMKITDFQHANFRDDQIAWLDHQHIMFRTEIPVNGIVWSASTSILHIEHENLQALIDPGVSTVRIGWTKP